MLIFGPRCFPLLYILSTPKIVPPLGSTLHHSLLAHTDSWSPRTSHLIQQSGPGSSQIGTMKNKVSYQLSWKRAFRRPWQSWSLSFFLVRRGVTDDSRRDFHPTWARESTTEAYVKQLQNSFSQKRYNYLFKEKDNSRVKEIIVTEFSPLNQGFLFCFVFKFREWSHSKITLACSNTSVLDFSF